MGNLTLYQLTHLITSKVRELVYEKMKDMEQSYHAEEIPNASKETMCEKKIR